MVTSTYVVSASLRHLKAEARGSNAEKSARMKEDYSKRVKAAFGLEKERRLVIEVR